MHYVFAQKVTYDKSFCFPFELDMQAKAILFMFLVLGEVRFQLDQTYFSFSSLSESSFSVLKIMLLICKQC